MMEIILRPYYPRNKSVKKSIKKQNTIIIIINYNNILYYYGHNHIICPMAGMANFPNVKC